MLFLNENLMAFWSIPMKETMKKTRQVWTCCVELDQSRDCKNKKTRFEQNSFSGLQEMVLWWLKKRAIIPPLSPCKCQIIENDKILTFCNLSPQLTKKSHIKIEWCQPPQKKTKQNSWQNKRQASSVSLLNLPYMKPNYPQAPRIPPRPPNPITLWTKNKHRILLFIYEKEIRIVKLNEMCVEATKSQNKKETLSWF